MNKAAVQSLPVSSESEMEDAVELPELRLRTPTLDYRATTLGKILMETLEELFQKNKITKNICRKTWSQFDRSVICVFQRIPRIHLAFKAQKLHTYLNLKQDEWIFVLDNVEFRERNMIGNVSRVKMIVSDGRDPTPKALKMEEKKTKLGNAARKSRSNN